MTSSNFSGNANKISFKIELGKFCLLFMHTSLKLNKKSLLRTTSNCFMTSTLLLQSKASKGSLWEFKKELSSFWNIFKKLTRQTHQSRRKHQSLLRICLREDFKLLFTSSSQRRQRRLVANYWLPKTYYTSQIFA